MTIASASRLGGVAPTPAAARPAATTEPIREGYDPARDAKADIAAALAEAGRDGRPVLLDFGADWCPDCVVLGRTFRTATNDGSIATARSLSPKQVAAF